MHFRNFQTHSPTSLLDDYNLCAFSSTNKTHDNERATTKHPQNWPDRHSPTIRIMATSRKQLFPQKLFASWQEIRQAEIRVRKKKLFHLPGDSYGHVPIWSTLARSAVKAKLGKIVRARGAQRCRRTPKSIKYTKQLCKALLYSLLRNEEYCYYFTFLFFNSLSRLCLIINPERQYQSNYQQALNS